MSVNPIPDLELHIRPPNTASPPSFFTTTNQEDDTTFNFWHHRNEEGYYASKSSSCSAREPSTELTLLPNFIREEDLEITNRISIKCSHNNSRGHQVKSGFCSSLHLSDNDDRPIKGIPIYNNKSYHRPHHPFYPTQSSSLQTWCCFSEVPTFGSFEHMSEVLNCGGDKLGSYSAYYRIGEREKRRLLNNGLSTEALIRVQAQEFRHHSLFQQQQNQHYPNGSPILEAHNGSIVKTRFVPKLHNRRNNIRAPRMRWTSSLHARFVHAVELLGGHESMLL